MPTPDQSENYPHVDQEGRTQLNQNVYVSQFDAIGSTANTTATALVTAIDAAHTGVNYRSALHDGNARSITVTPRYANMDIKIIGAAARLFYSNDGCIVVLPAAADMRIGNFFNVFMENVAFDSDCFPWFLVMESKLNDDLTADLTTHLNQSGVWSYAGYYAMPVRFEINLNAAGDQQWITFGGLNYMWA